MNPTEALPPAEKTRLTLGYMRLTDSAPLVVANELNLFAEFGLEVDLIREVSWANLRDRLVMNDLDAAQLLSPLPMMTTYGAGGLRANILTGLVLSLNGNAITLSNSLVAALGLDPGSELQDPAVVASSLRKAIDRGPGVPAFTLATVHLFSMHTILLRKWLRDSGINPDRDVRIIVLPPEQMCDSLSRGIIDGYCVGEPWNTVAVARGIGCIVATGYQVCTNTPEKVLGVTEAWHDAHPATHLRLRLALMKACRCLAEKAQREQAAQILARKEYLDLPTSVLLPSLLGRLSFSKQGSIHEIADFHVFWRHHSCFPWRSHAEWVTGQCAAALARPIAAEQIGILVQRCYRPDLYREAARILNLPIPASDYQPPSSGPEKEQTQPQ